MSGADGLMVTIRFKVKERDGERGIQVGGSRVGEGSQGDGDGAEIDLAGGVEDLGPVDESVAKGDGHEGVCRARAPVHPGNRVGLDREGKGRVLGRRVKGERVDHGIRGG